MVHAPDFFRPRPDYATDRKWADQFIPHVRAVVGPLLLQAAPMEVDCREATDLIVLMARDMRIAVRIRRRGYFEKYPLEFTIRDHRESGAETEHAKIRKGFGDWFLYGHGDERSGQVTHWMLLDLHAYRFAEEEGVPLVCQRKANGDGTYFVAYKLLSFPPFGGGSFTTDPPILIACSPSIQRMLPTRRGSVPSQPALRL
jgi:hypothetical protein